MRLLVIATLFACASAAPSGDIVPVAIVKAADPGDVEAAVIDAKVKIEDQVQQASDRARELTEQSLIAQTDKVIETTALAKEQTLETLWSIEDKKWQAVDAVQTAEAKIDGSIANNPDAVPRSYGLGLVVPLPRPVAPITPAAAPIAPISPLNALTPLLYGTPGILPADKLNLLKAEKMELEKKIEFFEKQMEQIQMLEKQKMEFLEKQKMEFLEKQKEFMDQTKLMMEKENEMKDKMIVKVAELDKDGEKKAALEKNLSEKPALLLYNVHPEWPAPLYVQNPLVLKQW